MRFAIHGLSPGVAVAVDEAFRAGGHELGEPADTVVVGVAGKLPSGVDLLELSRASWDASIAGARSAFFAMQKAARSIVEQGKGGCLLVVVPVHALRTSRGCGPAAVVGSFLVTAAQVAAVELGAKGIRVNVLAVGPLEGEVAPRTAEAVPLGRLTRPSDVGAACMMLASPAAGYLTGTVVAVDGGYAVTKAVGGSPFAA
jgi:NAD(P)-dependent dehydrogenase (short-subunit alcohol dehydrogenase family)